MKFVFFIFSTALVFPNIVLAAKAFHITNLTAQCSEGHIDGEKIGTKKKCLKISEIKEKYRIRVEDHCFEGYAEGERRWGNKECLEIKRLGDSYKTYFKEKCIFNYVEGVKWGKNKECIRYKKIKNRYAVHSKAGCADGYAKGWHGVCLQISRTNRYAINPKDECHVSYAEGLISKRGKECVKVSLLKQEYEIHSEGRCASSYMSVTKSANNSKNRKHYCRRNRLKNH